MKEPQISKQDVDAIHRAMEIADEFRTYAIHRENGVIDAERMRHLRDMLEVLHEVVSMLYTHQKKEKSVEARMEKNKSLYKYEEEE